MNKISKEKEDEIISSYERLKSSVKVGKEVGISNISVLNTLRRRNIPYRSGGKPRKYTLNEFYFHDITEDEAYWFGFLCADGNIYKNNLQLGLSLKDIEHIEKFKRAINSNRPIYKATVKNTKTDKTYFAAKLSVYSKILCQKLISIGCTERKSLTLKFPKFENREMVPHFLRGYFDGDGSISKTRCLFSVVSNKSFIKSYIQEILKFDNTIIFKDIKKNSKSDVYYANSYGKDNILKIYSILYPAGTNVFLDRKKQRFEEIKNQLPTEYSSSYRGVCFDKERGTYIASFYRKFLGRYKTQEDARNKVEYEYKKNGLIYNEKSKHRSRSAISI